jgi:hypothetical protein
MARRLALLDGVEVICLERVAQDDHSEAGTGLNVGPNAVKAVKAIDPELADRITEASYLWHNWRISLTDGTVLFDLPLTEVAEGPGWRIRWSELYHVLREAAGPSVSYGCEITDIGRDGADASKTSIAWTQAGKRYRLDGIDDGRGRWALFAGPSRDVWRTSDAADRRCDLPPLGAGYLERIDRRLRAVVQRTQSTVIVSGAARSHLCRRHVPDSPGRADRG